MGIDREVVSCGLNIFDRFIFAIASKKSQQIRDKTRNQYSIKCSCTSYGKFIDRRTYQLAAMVSLYIAIKMRDQESAYNSRTKPKSFFKHARDRFCADDIYGMELQMLHILQWKVDHPTPMTFVSYYLCLMCLAQQESRDSSAQEVNEIIFFLLQGIAKFITELSVCVGGICSLSPASQVARASILVAIELLTHEALSLEVRNAYKSALLNLDKCNGDDTWNDSSNNYFSIFEIQKCLERSLTPEMLVVTTSDYKQNNSNRQYHPLSIARSLGLLDLSKLNGLNCNA